MALEPAWLSPLDEMDPRRKQGAGIWEPVLMAPAPERNSILNVIVPADGTTAATVENGDFGTSPIFRQLSGKTLLACTQYVGVPELGDNKG